MPESIDGKMIFSLLDVTASIQKTLGLRYTSVFWVKAEMNKLNHYPHSGHCYPDLVEKMDGKVIAQLKSTIWRDDYIRINNRFMEVVKSPLKDGIKMLFCAKITFDAVHGLALRITDIDPVFSLGELEREKQESIASLKKAGVFDNNRSLSFPLLPQRLAIISVETSKGYADFNKMINGNPWGYRFFQMLFPSLLQGDRAIESMMYQLSRIRKVVRHFDVVAIIRGGGGDVGLSCFNEFRLAKEIATFPIPVITGIGHATNETVVEMVANRNAITPTELADFLLQHFHDFSVPVRRAEEILANKAERVIQEERQRLFHTVKYFRSAAGTVLLRSRQDVEGETRNLFKQSNLRILGQHQLQTNLLYKLRTLGRSVCDLGRLEIVKHLFLLKKDVGIFLRQQNNEMNNIVKTVANMHPQNVLKRGYSITRINGKAVTTVNEVEASDTLETILSDGTVTSNVLNVKKSSSI